jgi:hypothetical protein
MIFRDGVCWVFNWKTKETNSLWGHRAEVTVKVGETWNLKRRKLELLSDSNPQVYVECLFLRSPGRVPYRTPSACAKRAAYPDPPPSHSGHKFVVMIFQVCAKHAYICQCSRLQDHHVSSTTFTVLTSEKSPLAHHAHSCNHAVIMIMPGSRRRRR